jgi:VCBS repeat-containing protein
MAKPSGSGGGKPDKGGGGGGATFAILGLDDDSDLAGDGDETNDVTSLSTNFVIEGTIDPSVLTDPNFSMTVLINGVEPSVDQFDLVINTETGAWTYTYIGDDLSGTVTVDASYTYTHPKNGKLQTTNAEPYPFTIDSGASNSPATISGDAAGAVSEDGTLSDSGTLTVTDPDSGEDTLQAVAATGDNGYGSFDVQADGNWTYTLTNSHADIQALAAGAPLTDTITVTSADGTDTQVITVTITGTNDVPLITGDTTGGVTEDGPATTGGTLTVNDTDTGQSALQAVTDGVGGGGHGTFNVQSDGVWTYALDNSDTAVQALAEGATLNDTLIVLSADGTPSAITVTITGTNDVPVITGDTTGGVGEDGTPTASGFLVASDPDTNESSFQPQTGTAGVYGTFSINSTGGWSYSLDNTAVQGLSADETRQETFDVTSFDGTGTETVTITITGTNDIPTITGATTGNVTEDGTLSATGVLTVADTDAGESQALSVAAGTASLGGYGTYQVQSNGTWTYTLDNSHADVQALKTGQTMIDTFTVTSADGTTSKTITVTINGADEAPPPPPPPPPPGPADPTGDPLYGDQWHLTMIGDLQTIWQEYSGAGVSIGIYDNGIEYTHPDLAANYDASKHVIVDGQVLDPAPSGIVSANHGTAVAGVIAAVDNDIGGVGIAFGASITGVNIFGGPADINGADVSGFAQAVDQAWTFDIINNSWGTTPNFNNETNAAMLAAFAGFEKAVQDGRGGLGTIIVKAAGNDWDSSQGDFLNASRYTITVAAHDQDGDASWYTNRGANWRRRDSHHRRDR